MRLGITLTFCILSAAALQAGTLVSTSGTPNGGVWVNGYLGGNPASFDAASSGEPVPFQTYLGGDFDFVDGGVNFAATWSQTYNPAVFGPAPVILGATIQLGLFDHDSSATGDQVSAFTINGFDFAAALNALLNASGGTESEYNIYTLTLIGTPFLNSLAASPAAVTLTLQNGQVIFFGDVDPTPVEANGAGLDYARLTIDFQDPAPPNGEVPEPSTVSFVAGGLALLGWARRRR